MRVLVINVGSSSVKFSVFDMHTGEECFKSQIDCVESTTEALRQIPVELGNAGQHKCDAVGHRVAHGGEKFKNSCLIDKDVVLDIKACIPLAPLHNPPILEGIDIALQLWPVPQVAVFDTAFHQTIPDYAAIYAVPEEWRKSGLRRYGFHGTSHHYIMERIVVELERPATELKIISCHLGNGASVCAIKNGESFDISMGMTPLEGLVMGTRSGDVDPGIFHYLCSTLGLSVAEIENALYHDSGLKALSGVGNDMRDIENRATAGDVRAQLAIEVYIYRIKKYIGAYTAAMGGVDVIVFTGGVGENSAIIRSRICNGLEFFGLAFDDMANSKVNLTGFEAPQLQHPQSSVKILVTQTREQWMIAKETHKLLN